MIPREIADLAEALAKEFGGELDDHIKAAYRILATLKEAGAALEYAK